jgi:hypothetical protein
MKKIWHSRALEEPLIMVFYLYLITFSVGHSRKNMALHPGWARCNCLAVDDVPPVFFFHVAKVLMSSFA